MAFITYTSVGIKAMSACVPPQKIFNKDLDYLISKEEIEKTINSIGIREKRFAASDVCASDLCYKAAKQLMDDNAVDENSIDVLLFLSQTPDYKIPATAPILQKRLGLPNTTACLDLCLGCSGYVYGLSVAYAYASMPGINKVLFLNGETFSKITSPYDKVNAPLYGDAGTATLIEKGNYSNAFFELMSDGSGANSVMISAGAYRNPTTENNIKAEEKEDGNIRSDHQIYMDGMDVFNFALRVVPKSIKNVMQTIGMNLNDVDYLILHQANKFMNDFFIKKMKFDVAKVPYCIDKFGNTSSTSIPLTIVSELENKLADEKRVVLCGFGAGLSWGTAYIVFKDCNISHISDY
jgi:3-oxoacyl-[acyl-carrier-protein] synthase-3